MRTLMMSKRLLLEEQLDMLSIKHLIQLNPMVDSQPMK